VVYADADPSFFPPVLPESKYDFAEGRYGHQELELQCWYLPQVDEVDRLL